MRKQTFRAMTEIYNRVKALPVGPSAWLTNLKGLRYMARKQKTEIRDDIREWAASRRADETILLVTENEVVELYGKELPK
jgi:hypothetical protein